VPASLCPRRRLLYQAQLDKTRKDLADLAATLPAGLRPALADPELIDALEELLNVYVVYGVAHDLARLRASRTLLTRMAPDDDPPSLSDVLPPAGAPPGSVLGDSLIDPKVKPAQAYGRYFEWCIEPADVGGGGSGVDAFFERYPLLEHAVQTITVHHFENIKLACERIRADWNDIAAAFFGGRTISSLVKIRTTGNDFHKGGKQVLILTFLLGDSSTARVVYKPSAVEMDCRILGDSDVFGLVQPRGIPGQAAFSQHESLTEIINGLRTSTAGDGVAARPLPTYRILPYNRGSIPDSYGYLEFLTHNPVPAEQSPWKIGDAITGMDPAGQDWIVATEDEERAFYHDYGMLAGLALAVSITDLHYQNVIVHGGRPHLIDLEDALKHPMKRISETVIMDAWDRPDDAVGKELRITHEGTSDLMLEPDVSASPRPATSVIYRLADRTKPGARATLQDARNRLAVLEGLIEVVGILADDKGNRQVKDWVRGLDRTVTRFVFRATADIAPQSRRLYREYSACSIATLRQNKGYQTFSTRTADGDFEYFFGEQDQRDAWQKKHDKPGINQAWVHPWFALEHKDQAWRDYLNCDVPSFYHELGSRDLLNSAGERVDVKAAIRWQRAVMEVVPPAAYEPASDGAYLPDSPVNMVLTQLDALKSACATPAGMARYLEEALEGLTVFKAGLGPLLGRMLTDAAVGQEVPR
jgi:hypothetical protein